jgi:hypothetical protein
MTVKAEVNPSYGFCDLRCLKEFQHTMECLQRDAGFSGFQNLYEKLEHMERQNDHRIDGMRNGYPEPDHCINCGQEREGEE